MPLELPQYQQNNTYPARLDRLLIQYLFGEQERVLTGFVVSQKAGTPDISLDITAGACVVAGDDIARQGYYLAMSNATTWAALKENFVMPANPGSGTRTDIVGIRIRDAQALGSGSNNDAILDVVQGAAGGAVPATPASFLVLCRVARTAGAGSIVNANITDVAPRSPFPYGWGDNAPTGSALPGAVYFEY